MRYVHASMDVRNPFPLDLIASDGPLVSLHLGPDGRPNGATACAHVPAPPERVWNIVSDLSSYANRVPMIDKVKLEGNRVTIHLKFKVTIVSVGFSFTADVETVPGRSIDLRWVSGEPRNMRLSINVIPYADGKETILVGSGAFDIQSLGWLVKYFLKHHPEIELGVFPGVAFALIDSMQRAALGR